MAASARRKCRVGCPPCHRRRPAAARPTVGAAYSAWTRSTRQAPRRNRLSASDEAWPSRRTSTASRQRRSSAPPGGRGSRHERVGGQRRCPARRVQAFGQRGLHHRRIRYRSRRVGGDGRLGRRWRGGVERGFETETSRGHTGRHRVLPRGRGRRFTARRVGCSGPPERAGLRVDPRVLPRVLDESDGWPRRERRFSPSASLLRESVPGTPGRVVHLGRFGPDGRRLFRPDRRDRERLVGSVLDRDIHLRHGPGRDRCVLPPRRPNRERGDKASPADVRRGTRRRTGASGGASHPGATGAAEKEGGGPSAAGPAGPDRSSPHANRRRNQTSAPARTASRPGPPANTKRRRGPRRRTNCK